MTDTDALVVTQEDRDAAAALIAARPMVENADIIRFKGADDSAFVQAFARHRIAAVEADRRGRTFSPAEIDQVVEAELAMVVAWLRGLTTDTGKLTQRELNSRGFTELIAVSNQFATAIANRTYRSQDNG